MDTTQQPTTDRGVDALLTPALVVDGEGRVLAANDQARALLGPAAAESSGGWLPAAVRDEAAIRGVSAGRARLPGRLSEDDVQLIAVQALEDGLPRFLVLFDGSTSGTNSALALAHTRLREVQDQLLHSERMASIGQLAAGVAHEINNPIGYVHSNLGTLQEYVNNLFGLIELYQGIVYGSGTVAVERRAEIDQHKRAVDYEFLLHDLPQLLAESREGIDRVRRIVQDLRDFSRVDRLDAWSLFDLHRGIDSTLGIVWNEIKYKARLSKEYGTLPLVECLPSQLNQVFMNILVNAAQALENDGEIIVRTGRDGAQVWVEIADNGSGIAPEHLKHIFDPFFTTKPVGKGTGLGLSISYGIVKKHGGDILVHSQLGAGTRFRIVLPVHQAQAAAA